MSYLIGKGLADASALTLTMTKRISDTTYQLGDLLVPLTGISGETVNA